MRYLNYFYALLLVTGTLGAEGEVQAPQEEFETLFEIVDLDESPEIAQVETQSPAPQVAAASVQAPVTAQNEIKAAFPSSVKLAEKSSSLNINFGQVYAKSPIIYTILLLMSVLTFFIWLYSQMHLRSLGAISDSVVKNLRNKLSSNHYDEALHICQENNTLFCKMLASGINMRRYGLQIMMETMQNEGKRGTIKFWQKIALLNDIAIIAPMLGLLGTVLGMFYAFYNVNRSIESVSTVFDGLGISVGTTLAGLVVAIFALILHSMARYRLVRRLASVENHVQSFATLIDNKQL